jgi:hypothetical protein
MALPGAPRTTAQRILGAVLWAAPGAIASHESAALLWGAASAVPDLVDLTFDDRRGRIGLPWVRIHLPRDTVDLRPVTRHGIPTTNPLRTLLDLGQVSPGVVRPALEHFLVEGTLSTAAVQSALQRHSRPGRHGVVALRAALEEWDIAGKPPDSVLELAMAELLARVGLPPATFHARVLGFEVDFAYVVERVVFECDGWEIHGRDRAQFERDRQRDAVLAAAGWVVLRFTWFQVTRRPLWVAEVIRETLAARSSR